MQVSSDMHLVGFKTMKGTWCSFEVDENATTDEIISRIATEMNAPKDKVQLFLDDCLDLSSKAITQENAMEVDERVQEQFNTNIVTFIREYSSGGLIWIKDWTKR